MPLCGDDVPHSGALGDLDRRSTEELAQRGLTRMTDGAYMTVTMLENVWINMMSYRSSAARVMVSM